MIIKYLNKLAFLFDKNYLSEKTCQSPLAISHRITWEATHFKNIHPSIHFFVNNPCNKLIKHIMEDIYKEIYG